MGCKRPAVWQGMAVGLLVSLLFSVVPLLEVRHVKPSLLLRQDVPPPARTDWLKWGVSGRCRCEPRRRRGVAGGLLSVGLLLCGGFVAIAFVLHLAGIALVRAVQPLRYARSFALRQAVLHIARPGNQTRIILLAVGLGAFFILGVRGLQANLLRDFAVQVGPDAPDMFLIDIQPDQRDRMAAFLDRANGPAPAPRLMPTLRAQGRRRRGPRRQPRELSSKCAAVGCRASTPSPIVRTSRPTRRCSKANGGTRPPWPVKPRSRSRKRLPARFFSMRTRGADPVRADRQVTGRRVGGESFGTHSGWRSHALRRAGREVTARVVSIRRVDWQNFRAGGFMFVFRPGTFEQAPQTIISALKGPERHRRPSADAGRDRRAVPQRVGHRPA